MDMKYDAMISVNKAESEQKINTAKKAIMEMLECREKITVIGLVHRTGLSKGFFYKNPQIRAEMDAAIRKQGRVEIPKRGCTEEIQVDTVVILHNELEKMRLRSEKLSAENQHLIEENGKLQKEVESLKNRVNQKELSLLKKI